MNISVNNGNGKKASVCFFVGSMAISGGTYVIVQHASYLKNQGYEITLAIQEPFNEQTLSWHDEANKLRCITIAEAKREHFDLVIATWWRTSLELKEFDASHYSYFVQAVESQFYPAKEEPLRAFAEGTYQFPISYVTEATWIQEYLKNNYNQNAALVPNGIRKDLYAKSGTVVEKVPSRGQPRILIEGPFGVHRKNVALTIRLALRAGAKDIWLMTSSPTHKIPGVSRVFSQVPITDVPSIYRSCDILLKLSTVEGMFGPPLEMFHCGGTALVFDVDGHDQYIRHDENAIVVRKGDLDGVVSNLKVLLNDRSLLNRLKKEAQNTAENWPCWNQASQMFTEWVEKTLQSPATNRQQVAEHTKAIFDRYVHEEKLRLRKNPTIELRYKVSGFAHRKFPKLIAQMKKSQVIADFLLRGRKAH